MDKNLKIRMGIFIFLFWLVISYTPPVAYNQDAFTPTVASNRDTFRFTAWADTKSGTAVLNAESIEVNKLVSKRDISTRNRKIKSPLNE